MEKGYKYYLGLEFDFEKDINLDEFEKKIGIKAFKKTKLADSKGSHKTAKIRWRTQEFTEWNTDEILEKFVEKFVPKLESVQSMIKMFNGDGGVVIVFTRMKERPVIALTKKSINLLAKAELDFCVDYF